MEINREVACASMNHKDVVSVAKSPEDDEGIARY
jgi:hypothetical protein